MTDREKIAAFDRMTAIADKGDHAELKRNKDGYVISAVRKKIAQTILRPNGDAEGPKGADER